jgi:phosphoglycolate phosphatase-like HAD superfamily hydrolase
LGVAENEAIYIGDSIYDNQCARNAAVAFGLAEWGSHTSEGFEADHIFKTPSDILSIL